MDVKELYSDGDVRIYHRFKNIAVFQLSPPPFFLKILQHSLVIYHIFLYPCSKTSAVLSSLRCISMDPSKGCIISGDHESPWAILFLMKGNQIFHLYVMTIIHFLDKCVLKNLAISLSLIISLLELRHMVDKCYSPDIQSQVFLSFNSNYIKYFK